METTRRVGELALPPIDQVGYVVRDLDATLARYDALFGPFTRLDTDLAGVWYRGTPADVSLRLAFGRSGDVEIEFIQPIAGASPHTEFLASGREGIHHVRYRVDDARATIAALGTLGFSPIWRHHMGHSLIAYLEHASRDGVVVEVLQLG
jgi:catechol 2,3-dioxygenase-like lactoylglutathione lyase family enzyme